VDDLPLDIRENNPNVDMGKTEALVVYRLIDGKAVVTPVAIGSSDMTHIIVKSGLNEADKVVIGPYKILESIKHDRKIRDEKEMTEEKKTPDQTDKKPDTPSDKSDK
jgi:hypothetical protein